MNTQRYYQEIDVIKGLAILMVVLGHSFALKPVNIYESLPIFGAFVREFQMPLFFLASGFLWKPIASKTALLYKVKRLLVPYLSFGLLSMILKTFLGEVVREL